MYGRPHRQEGIQLSDQQVGWSDDDCDKCHCSDSTKSKKKIETIGDAEEEKKFR